MKLLIVVSGLAMFVPGPGQDPTRLTAVLLDTMSAHGWEHMPPHALRVRQRLDLLSNRDFLVSSGNANLDFKLTKNGQVASISLGGLKDFPHFGQLGDNGVELKIKADCLAGSCPDSTIDQNNYVAGVAHFDGGWTTRALQRCATDWDLPVHFGEKALTDFRKKSVIDVARDGLDAQAYGTALGLEAQAESLHNDLHLVINGVPIDLEPSSSEICKRWLGNTVTSCVVLEVENWADVPVPPACKVPDPPATCRLDEHFAAYYSLTNLSPLPDWNKRWVPYAGGNVSCPSKPDPGTHPSPRCPPGVISQ